MGGWYLTKQGLSSFDEVVAYYNGTKPIRGARADEDLRPLAERRYWWNRIHKASDNKYVLCDGHWAFSGGIGNGGGHDNMREQTAPIMWERREDGDYMTVRSHMNDGISVSRYTFLDRWLPKCMRFDWYTTTGKHFIQHTHARGYSEYYVPKFKGKMDWSNKTFEMIEDNKLVFKHTADGFERVGDLVPMQTRRIDKEVDAKYKPKMKEMWEWMFAVLPVLGDTLGDSRNTYAELLTDGKTSYWYWDRYIDKNVIRDILDNPDHDKRMALAVMTAYQADAVMGGRFEPRKESWAKFRACLRKTGGMLAVELR
jgi:hypothetical protein